MALETDEGVEYVQDGRFEGGASSFWPQGPKKEGRWCSSSLAIALQEVYL